MIKQLRELLGSRFQVSDSGKGFAVVEPVIRGEPSSETQAKIQRAADQVESTGFRVTRKTLAGSCSCLHVVEVKDLDAEWQRQAERIVASLRKAGLTTPEIRGVLEKALATLED